MSWRGRRREGPSLGRYNPRRDDDHDMQGPSRPGHHQSRRSMEEDRYQGDDARSSNGRTDYMSWRDRDQYAQQHQEQHQHRPAMSRNWGGGGHGAVPGPPRRQGGGDSWSASAHQQHHSQQRYDYGYGGYDEMSSMYGEEGGRGGRGGWQQYGGSSSSRSRTSETEGSERHHPQQYQHQYRQGDSLFRDNRQEDHRSGLPSAPRGGSGGGGNGSGKGKYLTPAQRKQQQARASTQIRPPQPSQATPKLGLPNAEHAARRQQEQHRSQSADGNRRRSSAIISSVVTRAMAKNAKPKVFAPIRESPFVPLQLVHPFRRYPDGTAFDVTPAIGSFQASAKASKLKKPNGQYLDFAKEPACSFWSRDESTASDPAVHRKLVVMDLNGALVVRSQWKHAGGRRATHPRAFLGSLLQWLMQGSKDNSNSRNASSPCRPWDAFVWSSARPENVQSMVAEAFGEFARPGSKDNGHLLGVWNRSHMGLSPQEFMNNVDTYKDLREISKMYDRFATTGQLPDDIHIPNPPFTPDVSNMILLDDSFKKPAMQPFNHVPIPEYTQPIRKETEERIQKLIRKSPERFQKACSRTFDGSTHDLEAAVAERMLVMVSAFGPDPLRLYEKVIKPSIAGDAGPQNHQTDVIMLAVVGILAELSDVSNIQAWLAAGGLTPDVRHMFTERDAQAGWEAIVRADLSLAEGSFQSNQLPEVNPQSYTISPIDHRVPDVFPGDERFVPWYQSPPHLLYWLRRGLIALDERKIPVDFGETLNDGHKHRMDDEVEVNDELA